MFQQLIPQYAGANRRSQGDGIARVGVFALQHLHAQFSAFARAEARLQEDRQELDALPRAPGAVAHQIPDVEEALDELVAAAALAAARQGNRLRKAQFLQPRELAADRPDIQPCGLAQVGCRDGVPVQIEIVRMGCSNPDARQ